MNEAVFIDPDAPSRLAIRSAPEPKPRRDEAVVAVAAISLNRGETVRATSTSPADWRPGWDLAGVVEQGAADGSGPRPGARVVGLVREGAWARRVAATATNLAQLPDEVGFAVAASLPVACLTALRALDRGGLLLGQRVLVTGASGGVGDFALQLARAAGASRIAAHLRHKSGEAAAMSAGATEVIVGELTETHGLFDLVVESVGGALLGQALGRLAPGGLCASLGVSDAPTTSFDARTFFLKGRARLIGINLFEELSSREAAGVGLARLLRLVVSGALTPRISVEAPWAEIASVARQLVAREFSGKAVLHVA